MKQAYQKPAVYAESFMMTEHIASGCIGSAPQPGAYPAYHDGGSCVYYDEDQDAYFTMGSTVCADVNQVPEGGASEGMFFCYQGSTGGFATPFHS